jgi:pimeloyl-ACP methyl ester carboxylesterase
MKTIIYLGALILASIGITDASSQDLQYPYPLKYLQFQVEHQPVRMAYMDVASQKPNGRSVILFHGKNFNGFYWKDVIVFLNELGYRVIVPDQIGFGESSKPNIHYSFHLMAAHSKQLLDSLKINKACVIGHSMGGMLATRFTLLYPAIVETLILENPIGLEDYRRFVSYTPLDTLYKQELAATYDSYKKYQQTYYPVWKPAYEPLVAMQARDLGKPDFSSIAWANALTYQMIYEQAVCYEFSMIQAKTLLLIGISDRTIVGKAKVPLAEQEKHGQYQVLGKQVQRQIPGSQLVELEGVGHIPHIQDIEAFKRAVKAFLSSLPSE